MDLSTVEPAQFDLVEAVVQELIVDGLIASESIMVVGAECRDILHRAHGHVFNLRRTGDLDVGLAVNDWHAHDAVLRRFTPTGHTGIRYTISGIPVDVMPFGPVEAPRGEVTPARRADVPVSVFGFQEVFDGSVRLSLPGGTPIRIPTPAGYAALKLRAWRDRWTASFDTKDGPDLATVVFWYSEDPDIASRLWDTPAGLLLLESAEYDYPVAAARLLGRDAIVVMGAERANELRPLWRGLELDELAKVFGDPNLPGWPTDRRRRRNLVDGLTAGLMER